MNELKIDLIWGFLFIHVLVLITTKKQSIQPLNRGYVRLKFEWYPDDWSMLLVDYKNLCMCILYIILCFKLKTKITPDIKFVIKSSSLDYFLKHSLCFSDNLIQKYASYYRELPLAMLTLRRCKDILLLNSLALEQQYRNIIFQRFLLLIYLFLIVLFICSVYLQCV